MKRYSLLCVLAFIAGLYLFVSQVTIDSAEGFNPMLVDSRIGASAPDFVLKDLTGKEVSLSSLKGKNVLLNFWATWCPYCRKERNHLNMIHAEYGERGLAIISVSIDRSIETVKNYMKKNPSEFPVLSDSDGTVAALYNIAGLPTSYFIDEEGIVKKKFTGFRDWTGKGSKQYIDKFLAE